MTMPCGFLGEGAPVFEIREVAGDASDLLIRSQALGAALARSLGGGYAVLMRGHGSTVVGESIRHAVYRTSTDTLRSRGEMNQSDAPESGLMLNAEVAPGADAR